MIPNLSGLVHLFTSLMESFPNCFSGSICWVIWSIVVFICRRNLLEFTRNIFSIFFTKSVEMSLYLLFSVLYTSSLVCPTHYLLVCLLLLSAAPAELQLYTRTDTVKTGYRYLLNDDKHSSNSEQTNLTDRQLQLDIEIITIQYSFISFCQYHIPLQVKSKMYFETESD